MPAAFIHRALMRVRPEPLAAILKFALRISRREIATPFGRFFADPASNFGIRLMSDYGYEPHETSKILELTKDARSFLDVGANEGYFSVIAAKTMGDRGRVLAIEPQSRLLAVMQKNMKLNDVSFEIFNCAIADRDDVAPMFFSSSINTGTTGFVRTTRYPRLTKMVRVARLEAVLHKANFDAVDCMKMDIEGLEYEAIMGSPRLFETRSIKSMLIEMHPHQMVQRGNDPNRLIHFLKGCGYRNNEQVWYA